MSAPGWILLVATVVATFWLIWLNSRDITRAQARAQARNQLAAWARAPMPQPAEPERDDGPPTQPMPRPHIAGGARLPADDGWREVTIGGTVRRFNIRTGEEAAA